MSMFIPGLKENFVSTCFFFFWTEMAKMHVRVQEEKKVAAAQNVQFVGLSAKWSYFIVYGPKYQGCYAYQEDNEAKQTNKHF